MNKLQGLNLRQRATYNQLVGVGRTDRAEQYRKYHQKKVAERYHEKRN